MSLVRFQAKNHRQQILARGGADDAIDDRATTPEDFARFDKWLGPFTLDVAASPANAKCARYFTYQDDGLRQSWAGERVWCNPPYSRIGYWVEKAWRESPGTDGIAMLLPANRTEQSWWQQMVEPYRDAIPDTYRDKSPLAVTFLPGRMRFIKAGADSVGPNERPPFGCCLLTWDLDPSSLRWTEQQELDFGDVMGFQIFGTDHLQGDDPGGQLVDLGDGITVCVEPGQELTDDEKQALREYFARLRQRRDAER